MKKLMILLFAGVTGLVAAEPTYFSLTKLSAADGAKGFREQVMNVPENGKSKENDIVLSYSTKIPFDASLIDQTPAEAQKLRLQDVNWCTNGLKKIKIYIPPHIAYLKIAMQYFPINYGLGFATFRPAGGIIDEKNAKGKEEVGSKTYYDNLWNKGKTVVFKVNETADIAFESFLIKYYGIDTSKGGYLYLTFTQASNIIGAARKYDPRYAIGISVDMNFEHPFTQQMRDDVLSAIPAGLDEPIEPAVHVISRECKAPLEYDLVTESGKIVPPDEACSDKGGVYEGNVCYMLPAEQEKYDCVVTDGDVWDNGRCVRLPERECNAQSDKHWFVEGGECLYTYDAIDTDPNAQEVPKTLQQDINGSKIKIYDYVVNPEGWRTQFYLSNTDTAHALSERVTVLDDNATKLADFNFTIAAGSVWSGRLFYDNGQLTLEAPTDSEAADTVFKYIDANVTKGTLVFEGNESAIAATTVKVEYGNALSWKGQATVTPEEQACMDAGGFYSADTGECYGGKNSSASSSSVSSVRSSSSSSASYSSTPTQGSSTSAYDTRAEQECQQRGGFYSADTGECYGAKAQSSSSSSVASESPEEKSCHDRGGYYALSKCWFAEDDNSDDDPVYTYESEQDALAGYLAGKTFKINGWFAEHDFENAPTSFDWAYVTPEGDVYQLHGNQPGQESVFGWKKVYFGVSRDEFKYAMVFVGDWDRDGSTKFDWIVINLSTHKVDKLAGANANGTFRYLEGGINIDAEIGDNEITFRAKDSAVADTSGSEGGGGVLDIFDGAF